KPADKLTIATKYAGLLNSATSQDLALASLQKSLLALADAHHALAAGDALGVSVAVADVEAELQNTANLTARFQAANKTSK
ncbi:MAG TPA: hypothetical protein VH255_03280, partial [Verrucomicrobiae bacterium]|nr:hypothetical protein [Verrucomicrobiae bacterium]